MLFKSVGGWHIHPPTVFSYLPLDKISEIVYSHQSFFNKICEGKGNLFQHKTC